LYVIAPTTAGPMNPGKVAIVLVRPISVPTFAKHNKTSSVSKYGSTSSSYNISDQSKISENTTSYY